MKQWEIKGVKERGGGRSCARDITGKDVRDIEGVTQRQRVRGRETTSERQRDNE
tara:strand:- start:367 stop:528 length:162 start_codon:yes stop_codon:yes gene_type:complete